MRVHAMNSARASHAVVLRPFITHALAAHLADRPRAAERRDAAMCGNACAEEVNSRQEEGLREDLRAEPRGGGGVAVRVSRLDRPHALAVRDAVFQTR